MDIEQQVARHYSRGGIEEAILDALSKSGKNIDNLTTDDLSGADEFHLGWHAQTVEFANELDLRSGMHILDIGSGIGGPARTFAQLHGCRVTGIDLTEDFVVAATALTRRCGLADLVSFQQASALALPFPDAMFDGVVLIHVGMNIPDKARLFSEARRVLKPGARFGVYDIMRTASDELPYPMLWAQTPATSFVETADAYRKALTATGFEIEGERDRREFSLKLGREMRESIAKNGVPSLGHILIGPAAPERFGNVMSALERGIITPVEIIARAV